MFSSTTSAQTKSLVEFCRKLLSPERLFIRNAAMNRQKRRLDGCLSYMEGYESYWFPDRRSGEYLWFRMHPTADGVTIETAVIASTRTTETHTVLSRGIIP